MQYTRRFYKGTIHAEQEHRERLENDADDEIAKKVISEIEFIKTNRHWGQPYVRLLGNRFTFACQTVRTFHS